MSESEDTRNYNDWTIVDVFAWVYSIHGFVIIFYG